MNPPPRTGVDSRGAQPDGPPHGMGGALRIAIVGAESTGKTELARALADRIAAETGLACAWVPEWLRLWCEREGRVPLPHEQAGIAAAQQQRIEQAGRTHDVVICDTTALMTAVYSEFLFGDASLTGQALAWQRDCTLTLLTALDLPWQADGHQRDGPHVRDPVDALLRRRLLEAGLTWSVVGGRGEARLESALDAVSPLLRERALPRSGLLSRLQGREAAQPAWVRACDCDDSACEHALRRGPAPA